MFDPQAVPDDVWVLHAFSGRIAIRVSEPLIFDDVGDDGRTFLIEFACASGWRRLVRRIIHRTTVEALVRETARLGGDAGYMWQLVGVATAALVERPPSRPSREGSDQADLFRQHLFGVGEFVGHEGRTRGGNVEFYFRTATNVLTMLGGGLVVIASGPQLRHGVVENRGGELYSYGRPQEDWTNGLVPPKPPWPIPRTAVDYETAGSGSEDEGTVPDAAEDCPQQVRAQGLDAELNWYRERNRQRAPDAPVSAGSGATVIRVTAQEREPLGSYSDSQVRTMLEHAECQLANECVHGSLMYCRRLIAACPDRLDVWRIMAQSIADMVEKLEERGWRTPHAFRAAQPWAVNLDRGGWLELRRQCYENVERLESGRPPVPVALFARVDCDCRERLPLIAAQVYRAIGRGGVVGVAEFGFVGTGYVCDRLDVACCRCEQAFSIDPNSKW